MNGAVALVDSARGLHARNGNRFLSKALDFSSAADADSEKTAWAPQRPQWYEGLAEALWWQARFAEAVDAYTSMRRSQRTSRTSLLRHARGMDWRLCRKDRVISCVARECEVRGTLAREMVNGHSRYETRRRTDRQGSVLYRLGDVSERCPWRKSVGSFDPIRTTRATRTRGRMRVLGISNLMLGTFEKAYSYLEQARDLYQELGDRRGVCNMLSTMGEDCAPAWRLS